MVRTTGGTKGFSFYFTLVMIHLPTVQWYFFILGSQYWIEPQSTRQISKRLPQSEHGMFFGILPSNCYQFPFPRLL